MADRDLIYRTLWQGARPETGPELARSGFSAVVLCEDDYQPNSEEFPGVSVWRCPFSDTYDRMPSNDRMVSIRDAARKVSVLVRRGDKVLVACFAGLNRSGLVTALALHKLTGWSGEQIVDHIQARREHALDNPVFARFVKQLPARRGRL